MTAWRVNDKRRRLVYPLLWGGLCCLTLSHTPVVAQTDVSARPSGEEKTYNAPDLSSGKKRDLPFHAEMQFDFRARVPFQEKTSSRLHSSYLSLQTEGSTSARGVTLNLLGMDQYSAFRWQ